MYKVAVYKCNTCGRSTQQIEEVKTQYSLACNITLNCTGQLVFTSYKTTRSQITSAQVGEKTVEDFIQRGFDEINTTEDETNYTSIRSGLSTVNLAIPADLVKSTLESDAGVIDVNSFRILYEQQNGASEVSSRISEGVKSNDGYADKIRLNFIAKNEIYTDRIAYSFVMQSGSITISRHR